MVSGCSGSGSYSSYPALLITRHLSRCVEKGKGKRWGKEKKEREGKSKEGWKYGIWIQC